MQTCMVNLVSLDPPINGGTSRIGREIAQLLIDKARHNPQLQIIFAVNDQFASQFIHWLGPGADEAPYIVVPYRVEAGPYALLGVMRPDLIISPLYGTMPFHESAWFPGVPHIAQFPDTLVFDKPDLFPEDGKNAREELTHQLKTATLIVTISEFSRRQLIRHLALPPEKVAVISLGADNLAYSGSSTASLPESAYVLYPANTWPHKRHDLLFRAMLNIWKVRPDLKLVLTGGRSKEDTTLTDLMAYYAIPAANVIDLGFVEDEQLAALYRHAEALLFTSAYEGFGMPVLEAMCYGCPVICAPVASLPEIAGDAALYVESDNPQDWAEAFLHRLPARRATLIESGAVKASQFQWAEKRTEWAEIINRFGLCLDPITVESGPRIMRPYVLSSAEQAQLQNWAENKPQKPNQTEYLKHLLREWRVIREAETHTPFQNIPLLGALARLITRIQNLDNLWAMNATLYAALIEQQARLEERLAQINGHESNQKN